MPADSDISEYNFGKGGWSLNHSWILSSISWISRLTWYPEINVLLYSCENHFSELIQWRSDGGASWWTTNPLGEYRISNSSSSRQATWTFHGARKCLFYDHIRPRCTCAINSEIPLFWKLLVRLWMASFQLYHVLHVEMGTFCVLEVLLAWKNGIICCTHAKWSSQIVICGMRILMLLLFQID